MQEHTGLRTVHYMLLVVMSGVLLVGCTNKIKVTSIESAYKEMKLSRAELSDIDDLLDTYIEKETQLDDREYYKLGDKIEKQKERVTAVEQYAKIDADLEVQQSKVLVEIEKVEKKYIKFNKIRQKSRQD